MQGGMIGLPFLISKASHRRDLYLHSLERPDDGDKMLTTRASGAAQDCGLALE